MSMRGPRTACPPSRSLNLKVERGRVRRHRRPLGLRQVHPDEARHRPAVSPRRHRRSSAASRWRAPVKIAGMAFQNPTLLPWRTHARQHPAAARDRQPHRSRLRRHKAEYVAKAESLLAQVGLKGQGDKYPWQLSGGMQQRASLCRALIHEPQAPDARRALRRARQLHARGIVVRDARPARGAARSRSSSSPTTCARQPSCRPHLLHERAARPHHRRAARWSSRGRAISRSPTRRNSPTLVHELRGHIAQARKAA